LEERKNLLSSVDDEDVLESDEYKEVLSLIESELESVRAVYSEISNRQKELTTLEEGVGANVGDEVEYLKKKQQ
jgi:prefoldin subunit 5